MKKISSRIISLLLLCVLCFTLCACAEEDTVSNTDIRLSNTSFSGDDGISLEVQAMLDELEGVLKGFRLYPYQNLLEGKNSSNLDMDIKLMFTYYDKADNIIDSYYTTIFEFSPGTKLSQYISSSNSKLDSVRIAAEFAYEGRNYRTDDVELKLVDQLPVRISLMESPYTVVVEDYFGTYSYRVNDLNVEYSGSIDTYNLSFELHRITGDDVGYCPLDYRILNEDSVVYATGTLGIQGILPGDHCIGYNSYTQLPPGDYYIEFISD